MTTPPDASPADLEQLGEEIAALAADLHAVTYRLLTRVREFDEREGWSGGFLSCAHWLSWRTGIAPGAAREKVRVAHALAELPRISAAMETGELSYSKVRALTRIATPANEGDLLELARQATAAQVETVVRAWRRVDRLVEAEAEQRRHEARQLTVMIDDDGSYVIRGRLDPEVGALLERALDAAAGRLYEQGAPDTAAGRLYVQREPGATSDTDTAQDPPLPTAAQRRADALGLIVELALAHRVMMTDGAAEESRDATAPSPDLPAPTKSPVKQDERSSRTGGRSLGRTGRVQLVLHVDTDGLRADGDAGQAVLDGGLRVSAERSDRAMPVREVIWM